MNFKIVYKTTSILFIAIVSLVLNGCKDLELDGHYVDPSISIDGNRSDWESVPIVFDDEISTAFGVCHDNENLYILFSFNEPMWARLIQAKGVKIWINSHNKKDKKFGIKYTGAPKQKELSKLGGQDMPVMSGDRMKGRIPDSLMRDQGNDSIIQVIRKDNFNLDLPSDGSRKYAVKYGIYNKICAYEFMIPIKDNPDFFDGLAINDITKIKIGLEWGGMKMNRDGMKGGGPGVGMGGPPGGGIGGGGGMGGPPGGGMGGGPPGGMPDGMEKMQNFTEEQKVWFTYNLNGSKK